MTSQVETPLRKYRAQLGPISSNGGRKISLFERRNFNEGSLFNIFFLDKRTSYMMVTYSVKKEVGKRNVKFRRCGTLIEHTLTKYILANDNCKRAL